MDEKPQVQGSTQVSAYHTLDTRRASVLCTRCTICVCIHSTVEDTAGYNGVHNVPCSTCTHSVP